MISVELLAEMRKHYRLDWYGTHGVIHGSRVYQKGTLLAEQKGVNKGAVQLFSVFHDSQRRNESQDVNHGGRGAQLASRLRNLCLLNDMEFYLLVTACSLHTTNLFHEDMTIQVCFDSDRLDLGRVAKMPSPQCLCTSLAKSDRVLDWAWAYKQSIGHLLPDKPFFTIMTLIADSPAKT